MCSSDLRTHGAQVFYPELEFCTDNGAMIAFAAAQRMQKDPRFGIQDSATGSFTVRPRWELDTVLTRG